MQALIAVVFWLHLIGIVLGVGGGIALSQVMPRFIAALPGERGVLDVLEPVYSRISVVGLVVLLVTGPLLLWLKFGDVGLMNTWFWIKMVFALLTVTAVATSRWATRRFRDGEHRYALLMMISGRSAGIAAALAMLCAVLAFN